MSTYPIFLRTVSLLSICVHRENVYVRHDKTWSNLRVYSMENEKEKLLITTEYITQSHILRTSGLQFSVEQAVSNCFAFY